MFEAASFPFSYSHAAYKLHEVSKWYTMGMQPGAVSCPTYFNIEAYEGLPTEYRKLLDEAEATGYAALKAAYTAADDKNIPMRSEEHTSELQSLMPHLVCRLLLEKK